MLFTDEERFSLAIPLCDAIAFAIGWSDLGYREPKEALRKIVGLLAIDSLEYAEQWRAAAELRTRLREKWPDFTG